MLDRVANSLERYMDLLSVRQRQVASNIANADTPGYKTKDIDFKTEFLTQIAGTSPNPVEVSGLESKSDGNNVNLDREARLLSETALRFSVASSLMRDQIRTMRSAIEEGKNT
jgi:flagellar basal-body rod protein FlgB